jgi:hypothetical protein
MDRLDNLINSLPTCPFLRLQEFTTDSELLSFISWIVPFPEIIALLQPWTVAIGFWYVAKIGLRWLKAIR